MNQFRFDVSAEVSTPQPTLRTKRTILRPFAKEDNIEFNRIAGQYEVASTTYGNPFPMTIEHANQMIEDYAIHYYYGQFAAFAIVLKKSGKLIGCISVAIIPQSNKGECGFWIDKDYWNMGYCTEVLKKIMSFSFDRWSLNKVYARHLGCNPASGKVMLKSGMVFEGMIRQDVINFGNYEDMLYYGILRSEFNNQKKSNCKEYYFD